MSASAAKVEPAYLALIGDVRRSREYADRRGLQRQLEQSLERVNLSLAPKLASRLVLTLGDEFQGLLLDPEAGLGAILALEAQLRSARLRYALGWGSLSTPLRELAVGMDGPCFHRAREAMTRAKQQDRWVTVAGFGEETDRVLNGILGLIGAVRARWTPIQTETAAMMRERQVQTEVATVRGVALQTVHKALRGALYVPVTEAEEAVRHLMRAASRETPKRLSPPHRPSPTPPPRKPPVPQRTSTRKRRP